MALRLRENLSFCVCGERVILLDLDSDRYFCLGPALEASFKFWAATPAADVGGKHLGPLCRHGLLVPANGAPDANPSVILTRAVKDLNADCTPRLGDIALAMAAELAAVASLRGRPLKTIIARQRLGPVGGPLTGAQTALRAAQIAAALERSALFLGASDRCLARALAAMSMCRRGGIPATLVFGVRINPFGAHCWVQLGDSVLVGEFEQSRLFTPILSVP